MLRITSTRIRVRPEFLLVMEVLTYAPNTCGPERFAVAEISGCILITELLRLFFSGSEKVPEHRQTMG